MARFQRLPLPDVEAALDAILDAHCAVAAAGFVAVDLGAALALTAAIQA